MISFFLNHKMTWAPVHSTLKHHSQLTMTVVHWTWIPTTCKPCLRTHMPQSL